MKSEGEEKIIVGLRVFVNIKFQSSSQSSASFAFDLWIRLDPEFTGRHKENLSHPLDLSKKSILSEIKQTGDEECYISREIITTLTHDKPYD